MSPQSSPVALDLIPYGLIAEVLVDAARVIEELAYGHSVVDVRIGREPLAKGVLQREHAFLRQLQRQRSHHVLRDTPDREQHAG